MKLEFTGERLLTSVHNDNTVKHLHRYALALEIIKHKTVLDIASGEGYGSYLMSRNAKFVYGVDIDREIVTFATKKYAHKNLQFLEGSTSAIPLEDNSVDMVVSFETLEHHDQHDEMMTEIKRVLKTDGTLLISTPDKHYYSDLRNYQNQFHVKELYKQQFVDLVDKYFNNHRLLSQSFINGNSIIIEDKKRRDFEFYSGNFTEVKTIDSDPHFLIAQCSNSELKLLKDSIFDGKELIDSNFIENQLKIVYNSNSYKLGDFILKPLKVVKKFWRRK
ncbi:class I SAM-dependent methyltransferase [Paucihalobacter sp.]|uniref:class I SAM-dependent methyltransferase n=1 Tax=Paucihalobacter sp. TaxID=2850405 RepID=UPI002FE00BA1